MNNSTLLQSPTPANGANVDSTPAVPICPTPNGFADLNRQAKKIQDLIEQAQQLSDQTARDLVEQCLQSVVTFYGEGLARLVALIGKSERTGPELLQECAHDPAISGLLLVHGLHPVDLESRLRQALDKVRPYLESHGGNVELLELSAGYARLRLHGACKTCPSSSVTLELAVRQALEEACPDLLGFNVE